MTRSAKRITLVALLVGLAPLPLVAEGTVPELYRRSYALETGSDVAGALSAMDEIGHLGDQGYVFHLRRGWLLYLSARHAESAVEYRSAVDAEPKAVEPRLGLMLPLMAERRWAEAERVGGEVLTLAPGDFTATSRIAYIHYTQGRYADAESWYRRALAGFPSNVEMRSGLGWSLLKQGKAAPARVEFERILQVAPDHAAARDGLLQAGAH